jgi:hypothetical protein
MQQEHIARHLSVHFFQGLARAVTTNGNRQVD